MRFFCNIILFFAHIHMYNIGMKFKISKTWVTIIEGVTLCLFSVMGMLSANVKGLQWIATGILASIGFIGFWVVLPALFLLGLYMIIAKRFIKVKVDLSVIGVFVVLTGASILMTNLLLTNKEVLIYNSKNLIGEEVYYPLTMMKGPIVEGGVDIPQYLEIHTFVYYFLQVTQTGGFVPTNSALGGGFIGFMFAGMINSWSPVATIIISVSVMVIGFGLVFNIPIVKLFKFLFGLIFKKKEAKEESRDSNEVPALGNTYPELERNKEIIEPLPSFMETPKVVEPTPEINKEEDLPYHESLFDEQREEKMLSKNTMFLNSFNNSHGVKKAEFSLKGPIASSLDEESFVKEENRFVEPVNEEAVIEEKPVEEPVSLEKQLFPTKEEIKEEVKPVEDTYSTDIASRKQRKAKPLKGYVYPSNDLIQAREKPEDRDANTKSNDARAQRINDIFNELSLGAHVVSYTVGPTFTRFDVQMDTNRSVTTIDRYVPDLASRLGGIPVRFEKLVIGKSTSGLEVANDTRTVVGLKECLDTLPEVTEKTRMLIPFGKDIDNKLIYADLTKFPHMLVAGSTGSGKSIFMNTVIASLIMRNKPDELKLVLVDPKRVEMNVYKDIPHLLCPNISEPREALVCFNKLVEEMERRYSLFSEEYVNEIRDFNEKMKEKGLEKLPYIVVFIDEYADLSETCKEIRTPVVRIAQKARAAGIHLVLATQRPSVNVIDGVIKANISTHVALMVNNATDSMVILGEGGAETLSGNGDMIVDCALISRQYKPRLQGAYCSLGEINKICDVLRKQMPPQYDPAFLDLKEASEDNSSFDNAEPTKVDKDASDEALYKVIREDIVSKEYCSISYIQRSYGIGFPRAGRMFGRLQKEGVVALSGDARGCQVLIHEAVSQEQQMGSIEQSTLRVDIDEE